MGKRFAAKVVGGIQPSSRKPHRPEHRPAYGLHAEWMSPPGHRRLHPQWRASMHLTSWLRPIATRLTHTPTQRAPHRPAFHPSVEALEDRTTPAGGTLDPTFGDNGVVSDFSD